MSFFELQQRQLPLRASTVNESMVVSFQATWRPVHSFFCRHLNGWRQVGMRNFHLIKHGKVCPIINVERLWPVPHTHFLMLLATEN